MVYDNNAYARSGSEEGLVNQDMYYNHQQQYSAKIPDNLKPGYAYLDNSYASNSALVLSVEQPSLAGYGALNGVHPVPIQHAQPIAEEKQFNSRPMNGLRTSPNQYAQPITDEKELNSRPIVPVRFPPHS